ncbi:MAG: eukaryotic translation initiation factor-like protein 3 [Olpidium bornovanus]|uniref:Eukaryotic translation initiation factor-like protein 3 n=1 Tax=Olpidium bornovanus TaxID=278681 RepID=A0A8H7ZST0_9FUNG|nr:MAG: eukaryotic translation initiation factor-like protein 3 [Olpidium bornovanus]
MRYPTPSNALKRAEELLAVGQGQAALAVLQDVVTSRRSRSAPLTLMEPIVLKFIELAVEQRKGKIAKEGLYQYRNTAQNTSVATIELAAFSHALPFPHLLPLQTVVKHFIELAEAKVQRAQLKAEQVTLDLDDLEALETPEKLMISTVTSDANKDRTDRALVTPWLKFLWETYRTCLDILRNNARLEGLYQTTAHQAFQFCLRYGRKAEYRRLCDLLRNHLLSISRYSHQAYAVNLGDPESLQRHLDTRFLQLNAASELELWQEAFRSVEDIHNLLGLSKKPVKPLMQANYYETLAKIFLTAENLLFHSAAWNKYYMLVKRHSAKLGSPEEQQRLASLFLLSALAIPIISPSKSRGYMQMDESKYKTRRLTDLLSLSRIPTRAGLLKEAVWPERVGSRIWQRRREQLVSYTAILLALADVVPFFFHPWKLNNNVLRKVTPELRELYNILEVEFHPLSICNRIAPIVETLSKHEEYSIYCKPLHDVILTRLLQQVGTYVYVFGGVSVVCCVFFAYPRLPSRSFLKSTPR